MNLKDSERKGIVIFVIVIIVLGLLLKNCMGSGSSSGGGHSITCKSCGRTFEAGDSAGNYKNIARTGMCNNCYSNYKWASGN